MPRNIRWTTFAIIAAFAAGAIAIVPSGRLESTFDRFEAAEDPRSYIWPDASQTAEKYWPIGAGVGTFDEVFQIDQSLENMGQPKSGRAHNDFIELAIETGAAGPVLLALWLAFIARHMWRSRRSNGADMAWGGVLALLLIAGQSITDYPLRNLSLLAMAAFAFVLILRSETNRKELTP